MDPMGMGWYGYTNQPKLVGGFFQYKPKMWFSKGIPLENHRRIEEYPVLGNQNCF